jgi:hypothetical protein
VTGLRAWWRKGITAVGLTGLLAGTLAGCAGPTHVTAPETLGPYNISISMDPQTLNPPQLATLNYEVTDAKSGKPVLDYVPVAGALWHNILMSRDLQYFNHSHTNTVSPKGVSLQTFFPRTGGYFSNTIFQPAEGETQVYTTTYEVYNEGEPPRLIPNADQARIASGVRFELFTAPEPLRAGEPSQLVVYVTERGQPVNGLWPFLDAPGYMWVIYGEEGKYFDFEAGSSPSRKLLPDPTGTPGVPGAQAGTTTPGATQGTASRTASPAGRTPTAGRTATAGADSDGQPSEAPTFMPDVSAALATRTAQAPATLRPVEQTAQSSIIETPMVQPATGYGPFVAFSHTFPEPGLYKVWFEFQYRQQVLTVDWVVPVER